MRQLEALLLQSIKINSLINDGDSIIVAVSGGSDSVALLCLLTKLLKSCTFTGVYIDHNLRPQETGKEKELVQKLCRACGASFKYVSIDVAENSKKSRRSLEDCARHMRYRALEKIRVDCNADLIAVGHTSDDQAEQFFIRLIRGSGLKGLGGMDVKRDRIVRPLLAVTKRELLAYLEKRGVAYCIDSSNYSRAFLRNKVRLDLLPMLEQDFNPSIKQSILNTMSVLRDEEEYLAEKTDFHYRAIVSSRTFQQGQDTREELIAPVDTLLVLHPALRRRIIEKLCWRCGCRPTFKMIESIDSLTPEGRTGKSLHLPGNLQVIRSGGEIIFSIQPADKSLQNDPENTFGPEIIIDQKGAYAIHSLGIEISLKELIANQQNTPAGLIVDAELISFPLVLRAPRPGELFKPLGAPGRKKITRIFSDRKIPRHLRYRFPVLVSGGRLVAIPGLMIHDDFKTTPRTNRFLRIDFPDDRLRPETLQAPI